MVLVAGTDEGVHLYRDPHMGARQGARALRRNRRVSTEAAASRVIGFMASPDSPAGWPAGDAITTTVSQMPRTVLNVGERSSARSVRATAVMRCAAHLDMPVAGALFLARAVRASGWVDVTGIILGGGWKGALMAVRFAASGLPSLAAGRVLAQVRS